MAVFRPLSEVFIRRKIILESVEEDMRGRLLGDVNHATQQRIASQHEVTHPVGNFMRTV